MFHITHLLRFNTGSVFSLLNHQALHAVLSPLLWMRPLVFTVLYCALESVFGMAHLLAECGEILRDVLSPHCQNDAFTHVPVSLNELELHFVCRIKHENK